MEQTSHCYYKLYSSVSDDFILLKDKLPSQRICSPSYCFCKIVICPDHQRLSDTSHSYNCCISVVILLYKWMLYLSLFEIINFYFKLEVWMESGLKRNLIVPLGSHQTCILHFVASLKCYNYVFLIVLLFFRQTKLLRELMLTKRKKN